MSDLILELFSEEIPARMQANAREFAASKLTAKLQKLGIDAKVQSYITPRRLVLIVKDISDNLITKAESIRGPRVGAPEQAIAGFLRK